MVPGDSMARSSGSEGIEIGVIASHAKICMGDRQTGLGRLDKRF